MCEAPEDLRLDEKISEEGIELLEKITDLGGDETRKEECRSGERERYSYCWRVAGSRSCETEGDISLRLKGASSSWSSKRPFEESCGQHVARSTSCAVCGNGSPSNKLGQDRMEQTAGGNTRRLPRKSLSLSGTGRFFIEVSLMEKRAAINLCGHPEIEVYMKNVRNRFRLHSRIVLSEASDPELSS